MNYKNNYKCLVCKNTVDLEYLDLTDQPLANSYHKGEQLDKYPLRMQLCTNCWHSQLSVSVDPDKMFEHYLYISDTTKTLTDYFSWVTEYILSKVETPNKVLEIACNSGLLLEMFQNKGLDCFGVDPARNLRSLSEKRNLKVYVDYWNEDFAKRFKQDNGEADLILAFHVLPHVPDPNNFIAACKSVLSDTGSIFIQTSQCDMFLNNEFDVIYHEHTSYFTGRSIKKLAENHNLYVSSIIKTDIHSKSYLFSLQKTPCDQKQLNELIDFEEKNSIYSISKYIDFSTKAENIKQDLLECFAKFKQQGYTLIGYGAAAKGNTLLNYINYKLDFIIDDNPMKVGYLTPGMDIEICSIDILKNNYNKICFIPLAWNFYPEIKSRIEKVRKNPDDVFVRYFPNLKVEKNYV